VGQPPAQPAHNSPDGRLLGLRDPSGAFVADSLGVSSSDEIFVIEMMSEHPGANASQRAFTSASRHDERPSMCRGEKHDPILNLLNDSAFLGTDQDAPVPVSFDTLTAAANQANSMDCDGVQPSGSGRRSKASHSISAFPILRDTIRRNSAKDRMHSTTARHCLRRGRSAGCAP